MHFCPQCTKILSLGRHGDYFSYLGVPRKLALDIPVLEQNFRTLSRQFHPDYFYNATPAERRASLERSSYLNDAYRTLRQPIARIEYLLELEGLPAGGNGEGSKQVPASLLEDVFALNEELDTVREMRAAGAAGGAVGCRVSKQARLPIEQRRAAHERELQTLSEQWDALVDRGAGESERRAGAGRAARTDARAQLHQQPARRHRAGTGAMTTHRRTSERVHPGSHGTSPRHSARAPRHRSTEHAQAPKHPST